MVKVRHRIASYEALPGGEIKPSALLKVMQDAATADVVCLGADYDTLRKKDMIFVISKAVVRCERMPRLGEELEVRTWNSGTAGASFVRSFVFEAGGERLGEAATRWVLVSYSSRRILRPAALSENVTTNPDEALELEPSRRIRLPEGAPVAKSRYRATLTDTDANRHVNNTRYGDLLVDCCGDSFEGKSVREFEIHFISELHAGDEVEVSAAAEGCARFVAGQRDGTPVFAARLLFDR